MRDETVQPAIASRSRTIQERAATFRTSDAGRATWQIVSTLLPLSAGFALMFWSAPADRPAVRAYVHHHARLQSRVVHGVETRQ
jgi:hypothetical protein